MLPTKTHRHNIFKLDKSSVQKNIPTGFPIEDSLNLNHMKTHVMGPHAFVYVDTNKEPWAFRYFIISRQQFIDLLYAAHIWYKNGYKRGKHISLKGPAGLKIAWLEGKDG